MEVARRSQAEFFEPAEHLIPTATFVSAIDIEIERQIISLTKMLILNHQNAGITERVLCVFPPTGVVSPTSTSAR